MANTGAENILDIILGQGRSRVGFRQSWASQLHLVPGLLRGTRRLGSACAHHHFKIKKNAWQVGARQ